MRDEDPFPYEDCLEDGSKMPPLWTHAPNWPFDIHLHRELLGSIHKAWKSDHRMITYRDQRWRDLSYRQLMRVAQPYLQSGEMKPTKEWIPILFTPCGRVVDKFQKDRTLRTAEQAIRIVNSNMQDPGYYKFRDDYIPPNVPGPCDSCEKPTLSECAGCGELYCCVQCQRKEWKDHERICRFVWSQSGWMNYLLTTKEMKRGAFSNKRCEYCDKRETNKILLKKCSRCKNVHYCSVDCQKKDWKQHKKLCKEKGR